MFSSVPRRLGALAASDAWYARRAASCLPGRRLLPPPSPSSLPASGADVPSHARALSSLSMRTAGLPPPPAALRSDSSRAGGSPARARISLFGTPAQRAVAMLASRVPVFFSSLDALYFSEYEKALAGTLLPRARPSVPLFPPTAPSPPMFSRPATMPATERPVPRDQSSASLTTVASEPGTGVVPATGATELHTAQTDLAESPGMFHVKPAPACTTALLSEVHGSEFVCRALGETSMMPIADSPLHDGGMATTGAGPGAIAAVTAAAPVGQPAAASGGHGEEGGLLAGGDLSDSFSLATCRPGTPLPPLVAERERHAIGAAIEALSLLHAGSQFAGSLSGSLVFNEISVAINHAVRHLGYRRILVCDLSWYPRPSQWPGTEGDPAADLTTAAAAAAAAAGPGGAAEDASVFTLSIRPSGELIDDSTGVVDPSVPPTPPAPSAAGAFEAGEQPGSNQLVIDISPDAADHEYIPLVSRSLRRAFAVWKPDLIVYHAGIESFFSEPPPCQRLPSGRLIQYRPSRVTRQGLSERNRLLYELAIAAGAPVLTLAGAPPVIPACLEDEADADANAPVGFSCPSSPAAASSSPVGVAGGASALGGTPSESPQPGGGCPVAPSPTAMVSGRPGSGPPMPASSPVPGLSLPVFRARRSAASAARADLFRAAAQVLAVHNHRQFFF
ncbi:hypothetical protein H696_01207 [Fonticula alba]|uniref:Uncharacterized protein n=1 Tax=Fonticula alba TaxID=691883 RepID=A0A058ZBL2_FONAL|nr:hypothetical protein H696_01207 [Fonticula alba]KCV71789.1 hypothetical protein H696_01207 [Fonticula alba]|eukprot:XP_009493367.1 hypothetical protein H696_01207 [Fonticula alba]